MLPLADIVIVNRAEAQQLRQPDAGGSVPELRPDAVLVETRGAAGCVADGVSVAAPQVAVVDATGAGDAFAAAFAVGIASGGTVEGAARLAVRAGAWAVTVAGAQPSLPTMAQLRG